MWKGLFFVALLSVGALAQEPTNPARSYFLQLPSSLFQVVDGDKSAYLKTYLQDENVTLGYLKAGGDGAQNGVEILVFKRRQGSAILAVRSYGERADKTAFLEQVNGQWTDASISLVPQYDLSKRYYRLAPYGSGVEVHEAVFKGPVAEAGRRLYRLHWTGEQFEPRR
jgi:hypothetical protein